SGLDRPRGAEKPLSHFALMLSAAQAKITASHQRERAADFVSDGHGTIEHEPSGERICLFLLSSFRFRNPGLARCSCPNPGCEPRRMTLWTHEHTVRSRRQA